MTKAWYRLWEEIWYWLEIRAGWLWLRLGNDRASYWLDWLPAYCLKRYYSNLNKRLQRERKERFKETRLTTAEKIGAFILALWCIFFVAYFGYLIFVMPDYGTGMLNWP